MKIFFSILFFLKISLLNAQSTADASLVKWVNEADGLSQLNLINCVMDNNGFVWISSELGLFRYDWKEAKLVTDNKYPNIRKQRIQFLYKNHTTGVIYFRTSPENKNYSIQDNTIRQLKDNEGLFIQNGIFLEADHPMYTAIANYYKRYAREFWYRDAKNTLLTESCYYMIYPDTIKVLDKKGNTKVIYHYAAENSFFIKFDAAIIVIDKEKIGLLKENKIDYKAVTADHLIMDFIHTIRASVNYNGLIALNKSYYINHKNNIYKILYKDNHLSAEFVIKTPVSSDEDYKFSYSKENNLFLFPSSTQGMAIVKPKIFEFIYNQPNSFSMRDYAVVSSNEKWYNYNGWIYNTKTKALKNRIISDNGRNMRFLLEYENNYFYESKSGQLVSIIDLKTTTPFKLNFNFDHLTSYTYLKDRLWLSNEKKIACVIDNKIIIDTTINDKIAPNQIINTINAHNGNLIIGTSNGALLHRPFAKKPFAIKGLEHKNIRYIKLIDKLSFWVGTYGDGLFLVHKNSAYRLVDKHIDISSAHAIEEDGQGNLWITTNYGLITVSKDKAIKNTLKNLPVESYIFLKEDGLPTNEFNGGSTFPSLKGEKGTIGFPSMEGFVWFDSEKVKKHLFSGNIIIDDVLADNNEIKLSNINQYSIPKETGIIKIKFSYAYPRNNQNITLCYKFEDQKVWKKVKENTIILARYKKGLHKLQIKVKTHGFDAKEDVIRSFSLNFEPRFNETIWFWLLLFSILLIFISFSYFFGNYYRQLREKKLEQIINQNNIDLRISNETIKKTFAIISHDLKGPFNSILGLSSYILANSQEISPDELNKYVSAINSAANKNYQLTLQLLSWSLKQQNGIMINKQLYNLNDIIDKSISILTPLANQKSIEIKANTEVETQTMGYFDLDIIFNIMYNIISNAIKYSPQNSTITVKTYADAATFYIETQDAGQGMDSKLLATLNSEKTPENFVFVTKENEYLGGFGLTYAKELAALYNGKLEFKSERNSGTTVIFSFPSENK